MYTQTQKEKELSKNLVTGEFEFKVKKKNGCLIALVVAVGALALCLAVLTVVREMQLARLRSEVDQLTVSMIAVTANIKSLNQKVNGNTVNSEFRTLEDTIYADNDEPSVEPKDEEAMGKLKDITVMEDDDTADDDMTDDDDYGDDDDEESGYWYEDYDRRKTNNGRSSMVRLKPEDFMGSVVTQGQKRPASDPSTIHQIHRMLSTFADPANTPAEPMKEAPEAQAQGGQRDKRSVFPDTNANDAVVTRPDDSPRRKTKKFSTSVESAKPLDTRHTVSRTVRNSDYCSNFIRYPFHKVLQRNGYKTNMQQKTKKRSRHPEEGRRPFVAAHFHGNTSHLNPEVHEHYKGNGLVRVAHDAPHNVWYPAPWTSASPHPRPTLTRNGHVHVHHTGVYLVYVQIYYLDTHDIISWVLHRTNADIEGRETLLQCAQSSHSSERLEKPNSCFSAAALFLKAGDRLAVRNTGGDRHSLMEPEKSFIGLVKLADAEDPEQEL